jgi:hypothetical protein
MAVGDDQIQLGIEGPPASKGRSNSMIEPTVMPRTFLRGISCSASLTITGTLRCRIRCSSAGD